MKKLFLTIGCILALFLTTSAYAISPRTFAMPGLYFDGTTANCSVEVASDYSTDKINVVMTLWSGRTSIASWNKSGSGYVELIEDAEVSKGKEYELTVDVTINSKVYPVTSISKKCE